MTSPSDNDYDTCQPLSWHDTKHVIAFGDSYTFVQGTHGHPKYSFIGSYLPDAFGFTPERLLANRICQESSSPNSRGPNWIEYLTGCAVEDGLHSPLDSKVQLWDFAFAGANTTEALLPLHHPFTTSLVNQTQQFLQYGDSVLRKHAGLDPSNALVAIWIGINDVIDAHLLNKTSPEFYAEIINAIFGQSVLPLVDAGYKNFLLLNVPPLDQSPLNKMQFQGQLDATLIDTWNNELQAQASVFSDMHQGIRTIVFDTNTVLNRTLKEPSEYGIKNTKESFDAMEQRPQAVKDVSTIDSLSASDYFWFDSAHIGTKAHKALANAVGKFLHDGF
ncbi:hypothetical protein B0J13DRAFT_477544 [Dactylonectria estremocensis]|uniref:Lysophospholipase A n=1 Tax=Dactylonectria estremocensis TaxID=1079267 RepID=A0A9P9J3Y2_9HYPO|nr:hypothetical protein B0J13DRAFT_477544 [Dactylonectria estremocensis]